MADVAQTAPGDGHINARVLIEKSSPMTQTETLVSALVRWPSLLPEDLPAMVPLAGGVQLKAISKGDKYYLAVSRGCTYQAATIAQKAEAV